MQLLRALETYIPLAEIFAYGRFYEKEDTAFLDSSLENELGRYSILGLKPYLKLRGVCADLFKRAPAGESDGITVDGGSHRLFFL